MHFKEKKEREFDAFVQQMNEPEHALYVIVGDAVVEKEVNDRISRAVGTRPVVKEKGIKSDVDRMQFRSFRKSKYFVMWKPGESPDAKDVDVFYEVLRKGVPYGVLVVMLEGREEKKGFKKVFGSLERSKKVQFYDYGFMPRFLKKRFVEMKVAEKELMFESKKVRDEIVENLSVELGDVEDNLLTLEMLPAPLKRSVVQENIENYSDYSIQKLLDTLVRRDRKRVPYEVLDDLLSAGEPPGKVWRIIRSHFRYVYQAKVVHQRGLLMHKDIVDEKKELYDQSSIDFGRNSIYELSDFRRNKYMRDAEVVTIKEVVQCLKRIDEVIVEKEGSYSISKRGSYQEIGKGELFLLVIDLMGRVEEE